VQYLVDKLSDKLLVWVYGFENRWIDIRGPRTTLAAVKAYLAQRQFKSSIQPKESSILVASSNGSGKGNIIV